MRASSDHVSGRYDPERFPEDRGSRGPRVRRPGCVLFVVLAVNMLLVVAVSLVVLFLVTRPPTMDAQHAVWIGIDWGETPQTDEDVQQLTDVLRAAGVDTVYVWTTWLQGDMTWSETTFDHMSAFVSQFKQFYPEARLDAWVGIPVDVPAYRLDDPLVRATVAAFSTQAIETYGFDGIHLNAEPVWDGDENYLQMLREVRQTLGDSVSLSVAVPPDWNIGDPTIPAGPYTSTDAHWTQQYKQRVAFIVDEIAVMAYNSGLSSPEDYRIWMANQVTRYTSAIAEIELATELVIGIPTYDAELPGHDPTAESVEAAVLGIHDGLALSGDAAALVRGAGLYAYWSTDAREWNAFYTRWIDPESSK